jgi:hypothetical protein
LAYKPVETYPLELALEAAAAIIRTHGYISKKESATSGRQPTSVTLGIWLKSPATTGPVIEAADTVVTQDAMNWLNALTHKGPTVSESDFDRSMRLLPQGGYRTVVSGMITKSDFGFVACVYSTMERAEVREVKKAEAKEAASNSAYMGSIKKRAEFFVKLIGKKYSDNVGCYIYKVKDQKGNLGVFFSSDADLAKVEDCFLAKMTPKRHSVNDYHGGKETVFNRVKVVQNVGAPKAS